MSFNKVGNCSLPKMNFGIKVFEVDSPKKFKYIRNDRFFATNRKFLSIDTLF